MIPKRIFYMWLGGKMPWAAQLCVQTWREKMPDYEIIGIDEKPSKWFDWDGELKENAWFAAVVKKKMWAYAADYVRVKILFDHGGIWLDTDVSALKSFDGLLGEPAFLGLESCVWGSDGSVSPSLSALGAQKGNKLIGKVLDFYQNEIWRVDFYTIPAVFKHILARDYGVCKYPPKALQEIIKTPDITIYPEKYFAPHPYGLEVFDPRCAEGQTHSIHWWNASWQKPEIMRFLRSKHLLSIEDLDKQWQRGITKKIRLLRILPIGSVVEDKITLFGLPMTLITDTTSGARRVKLFGKITILKIFAPREKSKAPKNS